MADLLFGGGDASVDLVGRIGAATGEAAAELGATAVSFDEALARLGEFDVVVCSTSCPAAIISPERAAAAMQQRSGRPMFFIDAAMPRDVDAGVTALKNVFVYNLDDLAKIAAENRAARESEIIRCREILAERTAALWAQAERALQAGDIPAQAAERPVEFYPAVSLAG